MPVALTNACLIMAGICVLAGADIGALVIGGLGVLNQAVVEFAVSAAPQEADDGLG